MALNFPSSPINGQQYTYNGKTWVYNATTSSWELQAAVGYLPLTGGTISGDLSFSGTGYVDLPAGTDGQRPGTPSPGMIRYNTTSNTFEGRDASSWRSFVESGDSSSVLNFTQSGTGAVSRTVDSKLKDFVSVKDFGAVGDGITDDTAAVVAANVVSKCLVFPAGGNYCLMNWEPLSDTIILAHGATISRHNNTIFTPSTVNGIISTIGSISGPNVQWVQGTYTIGPLDYSTNGPGKSAGFSVTINQSGAATVSVTDGGYGFVVGNTITISGSKLGNSNASSLTFSVTGVTSNGSCGSLIVTNDNISVYGGTWTKKSGLTDTAWSTAILINGGDDFTVSESNFTGTWGAISGPQFQNGNLVSNKFSILNCIFENNIHNTYLSDINGLTFSGNRSSLSIGDGLKLFRNCKNCIITNNIFRDNGDIDSTNSRDGIDLFVAGDTCIISDNLIYGNKTLGIDMKLSLDPQFANETVRDQKYIISNNFIYSNGTDISSSGIRIAVPWTGDTRYIENVIITGNQIFENTSYGLWIQGARYFTLSDNIIHSNGRDSDQRITLSSIPSTVPEIGSVVTFNKQGGGTRTAYVTEWDATNKYLYIANGVGGKVLVTDTFENGATDITISAVVDQTIAGIRLEGSKSGNIKNNTIYNNNNIGILTTDYANQIECEDILVTDNNLTGNNIQTAGINISGIDCLCLNNQSNNHSSYNYYSLSANNIVKGKLIQVPFSNTTSGQFVAVMPKGSITSLETVFNGAVTTTDIVISRRKSSDGTFEYTLCNDTSVTGTTPYVTNRRTLNTSSAYRTFSGGESILITLSNITSSFTSGRLLIHYID